MCSATCVSAVCQSTYACVPNALCSCTGYVRDVIVWVSGCLNRQTKMHLVIRILNVIISSLLMKNRGLSVMDSVRRWTSALALKRATFLSHYFWSQSSTKRNQKLSLSSVRAQGTRKLLSGNAQCVVRIRPVMCNSSLENSFPLKLSWVLLLHISMLHHTEYIKFDVIFFSSLFPGNL